MFNNQKISASSISFSWCAVHCSFYFLQQVRFFFHKISASYASCSMRCSRPGIKAFARCSVSLTMSLTCSTRAAVSSPSSLLKQQQISRCCPIFNDNSGYHWLALAHISLQMTRLGLKCWLRDEKIVTMI